MDLFLKRSQCSSGKFLLGGRCGRNDMSVGGSVAGKR